VTPADYTLLVVDDGDDNRYMLTRRLAREGYTRVVTANDGCQALDPLAASRRKCVIQSALGRRGTRRQRAS